MAPRLAGGRVAGIEPFLFVLVDSFLHAVDILGCTFMSVATLFAAIWIAALGAVAFPGATWSLAVVFRGTPTTGVGTEPIVAETRI